MDDLVTTVTHPPTVGCAARREPEESLSGWQILTQPLPACPAPVEYVATLRACAHNPPHLGTNTCPEVTQVEVRLCRMHAAEIRSWPCLVAMRDSDQLVG